VLGKFISGEVLILSFCISFELLLLILWFCRFSCLLLIFAVFLLLDDILELFVGFWSFICASWGLRFELQTLCLLLSIDISRWRLRNQVISFLVWLRWVIDLAMFEFEYQTFQLFDIYLCSIGESRLLVSLCAGGRCGMVSSDKNRCRSRRPGAEDRGWSHRSDTQWSDDREVGWHRVRSAPFMWRRGARVSWLSIKIKVDCLWVVWSQNHWDSFLRFGLKIGGDGFSQFVLKTSGGFLGWASKPRWWRVFSVWSSKPIATVWWFMPQNHRDGFLLWLLKSSGFRFVICVIKPTERGRRGTHVEIYRLPSHGSKSG
jgi:hypothetical protein